MPAVAVTEHGNLFSAIIVHDHARAARGEADPRLRGVRRAWQPARPRRAGSENYNHLVLLAETRQGWHNLIKLVSAGYTEGFYRKPRIDKELLAQARGRAHRAEQLSQGRDPFARSRPTRPPGAARVGGDVPRHPRAATTSSSRCSGTASRTSRSSTAAWRRSRATSACRWSRTNDVHYLQHGDHVPHDVLLCIGTGRTVNDASGSAITAISST